MVIIFYLCIILVGILYMIFQSLRKKKLHWQSLFFISFFVGFTILLSFFIATVRANYLGQKEWQQEKQFFLRIFVQKLKSSGNLRTAALYMQSEEIKKETLSYIKQIVCSFHPKIFIYLTTGGVVLLIVFASLWNREFEEKKYYPYVLTAAVFLGTALTVLGVYYLQYAYDTNRVLKNILRNQQEFLMKDLAEIKTELKISEIIKITTNEADRIGFGYGQKILDQLRPK